MLLVLLLVLAGAGAARAHIDTFGTPDPYWQNLAGGSRGSIEPVGPGAPAAPAVHPWLLRGYIFGVVALLAAFAARGARRLLPELLADLREAGDLAEVRTVEVVPPSRRREADFVLGAAGAIVIGAILVIAPGGGAASGSHDLLPFQVLFRDAPPAVQRMYREMQEGLLEAERRRGATGRWPAVEPLAAEGIPPFAPAHPPYRWRLAQGGSIVNYVGMSESDGAAFLALVQEPDPNAVEPPATAPLDETHHRLADDTLLHVSIWYRPGQLRPPSTDLVTEPAAGGWIQVLVGGQPVASARSTSGSRTAGS
jgi:hypothetical protein